jgi:phospholipid/cholesterol/gamma-HCH transport system permease protein
MAVEHIGRMAVQTVEECGYYLTLLGESLYFAVAGRFVQQRVRLPAVVAQAREIGVNACPIVFLLGFVVGVMLAIQGVHSLKVFGAESQVVLLISMSVVREFGPLITGILVAGRSGSALAARIGTMKVSQEVDALQVLGIHPIRYLVSPVLLAMLVMVPILTFLADLAGNLGGAVFCNLEMGLSYAAFADQALAYIEVSDIFQGLIKSVVFAVLITLVGTANGFLVGDTLGSGAEAVGRATTRAVVWAISFIILADMIFTYFMNF